MIVFHLILPRKCSTPGTPLPLATEKGNPHNSPITRNRNYLCVICFVIGIKNMSAVDESVFFPEYSLPYLRKMLVSWELQWEGKRGSTSVWSCPLPYKAWLRGALNAVFNGEIQSFSVFELSSCYSSQVLLAVYTSWYISCCPLDSKFQ